MYQHSIPATTEARNDISQKSWNANATFWDERMGDGNDFHRLLLAPALERLLDVQPGQRILEAACGNGQFARRLADLGASVIAFDFAANMIEIALSRSAAYGKRIAYHTIDATNGDQLRALGHESFDAIVCNMAMMDMAPLSP